MRIGERMIPNSITRCPSVLSTGRGSLLSRAACLLIAAVLPGFLLLPPAFGADESAPLNLINATESDNGSTVKLQSGEGLSISLAITTGTGYSWRVARVDRKVLRP